MVTLHAPTPFIYVLLLTGLCTLCIGKEEEAVMLPTFSTELDMLANLGELNVQGLLILSYGSGGKKCEETVQRLNMAEALTGLSRHFEEEFGVSGIVAAMISNKEYEKSHRLKGCPNIILYRDGKRPIVYDGDNLNMRFNRDDIGQWVAGNMKSSVSHLSDETFEHLTQASTGATTGDWLIWFHNTSCSELTAVWDAVASRLQYTKVVGEVDITLNPKLAARFHLQDCQTIVLFRQAKYYIYTGDAFDVRALTNFAEISYKNFKSKVVRPPASPFDEKVEELTRWLKESTYGLYTLVGVTFLLFGGILYLVCQESRDAANDEKKDN